MKYCPRCKTEYRDDFSRCTDCGEPLADGLPSEDTADHLEKVAPENTELVLLTQVPGDQECMLTRSLLESYGIPTLYQYTKFSDISHLYAGSSLFGINIFVRRDQLELAQEILNAPVDPDVLLAEEEETENGPQ